MPYEHKEASITLEQTASDGTRCTTTCVAVSDELYSSIEQITKGPETTYSAVQAQKKKHVCLIRQKADQAAVVDPMLKSVEVNSILRTTLAEALADNALSPEEARALLALKDTITACAADGSFSAQDVQRIRTATGMQR